MEQQLLPVTASRETSPRSDAPDGKIPESFGLHTYGTVSYHTYDTDDSPSQAKIFSSSRSLPHASGTMDTSSSLKTGSSVEKSVTTKRLLRRPSAADEDADCESTAINRIQQRAPANAEELSDDANAEDIMFTYQLLREAEARKQESSAGADSQANKNGDVADVVSPRRSFVAAMRTGNAKLSKKGSKEPARSAEATSSGIGHSTSQNDFRQTSSVFDEYFDDDEGDNDGGN
jgi:hypothetical protein